VKVLVVEDEVLISDYICDVLNDAGFEVLGVAPSGEEALAIINRDPPDIALVDVRLAGPMDGITFAETLWDRHSVSSIFVTGSGDPRTLTRIEKTHFPRLQKPVRPRDLLEAILDAQQIKKS
jgi:two-component system, response regulator PdtaR